MRSGDSAITVLVLLLGGMITGRRGDVMDKTGQFEISKTPEEWQQELSPSEYRVLREHGTEPRGASPLNREKRQGQFVCAGCGQQLFLSDTKYESGTGWPSFFAPIEGAIDTTTDQSYGMTRVEVHCRPCGGHLGHVFEDGPAPTGERYCMNGVAMRFVPKEQE
jgi:peptide-methionine (R)-S-oxide reductase